MKYSKNKKKQSNELLNHFERNINQWINIIFLLLFGVIIKKNNILSSMKMKNKSISIIYFQLSAQVYSFSMNSNLYCRFRPQNIIPQQMAIIVIKIQVGIRKFLLSINHYSCLCCDKTFG